MRDPIFEHLFVLELANNHWGRLDRGLKIISEFSKIVRFNNVKAAIKLQFRDVDSFIHPDWRDYEESRYIQKTLATQLSREEYAAMVKAIKDSGCLPMATPFDEASVAFCDELDLPIIKIASSDMNDWVLIEAIAATRRPVIVSTGGSSEKDIDDLVQFFNKRDIPLAVNHCVSLYPSEDCDLDLDQIDYLKRRFPDNVIGFSTHEYHDWSSSVMMAYAKGARTFERHVDIEDDGIAVSKYCSLPEQVDTWFKAYNKAREMSGACGAEKRMPPKKEVQYLDELVRGVYAARDLSQGHELKHPDMMDDVFLAIPLQKKQISCRELMSGEVLLRDVKKGEPITIDDIDSPYADNPDLKKLIYERGISR